jgi:hypothetical protein
MFIDKFLEKRLYIWDKPFRIDDLLSSGIYKTGDIFNWIRKYKFDKWAIGIFVSEKRLKSNSPLKRIDDRKPISSEFGKLLDEGDLDKIKSFIDEYDKMDIKDIRDIHLRKSSKGVKSKNYFNDESKSSKGCLIEESKINFEGDDIYLYIFERGSNNDKRARQLNGIVYEAELKKSLNLEFATKGERWDAIGSLDSSYLDKKLKSGSEIYLNNKRLLDYNLIPQDFLQPDNNWSIKSCSNSSSTIYFADFKRISGLVLDKNNILSLTDKNLENFILVVGFHTSGNFTEEYIINVKLSNWKKLIPNVSNRSIILQLQQMYRDLEQHRLGKPEQPAFRTKEKDEKWTKYRKKWSKLTENTDIKLNFKRDTKGQLRIQCSMSKKVFKDKLLKNNDFILIKN